MINTKGIVPVPMLGIEPTESTLWSGQQVVRWLSSKSDNNGMRGNSATYAKEGIVEIICLISPPSWAE